MEISIDGKYDELTVLFSALADPTRRALLEELRPGDATVNALASKFALGVPAISKHLTVLEKAGLISRRKVAQWRHCHLERAGFEKLATWSRHYENLWTASLDGLDSYLTRQLEDPS